MPVPPSTCSDRRANSVVQGQQFALTEASYTTVRLCQAFDNIESRDPAPWTENLALTCVNLGGAKVSVSWKHA